MAFYFAEFETYLKAEGNKVFRAATPTEALGCHDARTYTLTKQNSIR